MNYKNLPPSTINLIRQGIFALTEVYEKSNYDYICIDNINCSTLPTPEWIKGSHAPIIANNIWSQLPANNKPCLYFFEITHPNSETILKAYKQFKNNEDLKHRASAALKKRPPLDTNILYVGKVKDDIGGRMVVHFAYYHVGATAGLQLACWAKLINLKLRLHIYSFDENMHAYVSALEQSFARHHRPLIGKH